MNQRGVPQSTHKPRKDTPVRKNNPKSFINPEENINLFPLDEIVRKGAKRMLEQALETEVDSFLERNQYILDDEGRRLVVRNGYAKG